MLLTAILYSLDTPPGTKLLFKDLKFNDGFLLMDKKDVEVLGGSVPALIEAWKASQVSLSSSLFLMCIYSLIRLFIHVFVHYSIECILSISIDIYISVHAIDGVYVVEPQNKETFSVAAGRRRSS